MRWVWFCVIPLGGAALVAGTVLLMLFLSAVTSDPPYRVVGTEGRIVSVAVPQSATQADMLKWGREISVAEPRATAINFYAGAVSEDNARAQFWSQTGELRDMRITDE